MPGRRSTLSGLALLVWAVLLAFPSDGAPQSSARALTEENFRREPNGVVLGRVQPGATVRVVGEQGNWLQVDLEGWVWLNSLQESDRGFDLVVSAENGENLRDGPSGSVVGRLEEGALLDELGREPGWVRVRRRGWIWSESLERVGDPDPSTPAPARTPAPTARRPVGFTTVGAAGAPILTAPDGDTLALANARSDLEVIARDGNWARVRLEGWVWTGATAESAADLAGVEPSALVPDDLGAEPAEHVGRVVAWELQFISLEEAEEIRTDFREGEPFLLTRFGGPDGPFVYVAVPPERMTDVEGLVPLERISVTARIRTGASSLTGTPIVDLLSLENGR